MYLWFVEMLTANSMSWRMVFCFLFFFCFKPQQMSDHQDFSVFFFSKDLNIVQYSHSC